MNPPAAVPRRLWRLAGGFALVYVACFLITVVMTGQPTVHAGQEAIEHSFVDGNLTRVMTGGVVILLGFVALLPAMTFLARTVGRRTEAGRWAAQTAAAAGVLYVAIIVGSGFAPGAASLWGLHHGLDLDTVLAVNNIRNFAYFVVMPVMGAYTICVGLSALSDRILTRWVGWGGLLVGTALLLAIPAAAVGIQYGMPLWLLWWLGVGVSLLRHDPTSRSDIEQLSATTSAQPALRS